MMHLIIDEFVAEIPTEIPSLKCICIFILQEKAMSNSTKTLQNSVFKRGHYFPCGLNMLSTLSVITFLMRTSHLHLNNSFGVPIRLYDTE